MPDTAPTPTTPGLDEAVRDWLIATLTAALPALNASLSRDDKTPIGTVTPAMVLYGDPQTLPDVDDAPILLCVLGGGRMDGMDMECEQQYLGGGGIPYTHDVHSSITAYLHPDAMPTPTSGGLESGRERLLARICDWLRQTLNSAANATAQLGSQEFALAPAFDVLDRAHVASVEKGLSYKDFGGNQAVYMAHARHTGTVTGTSYWTA